MFYYNYISLCVYCVNIRSLAALELRNDYFRKIARLFGRFAFDLCLSEIYYVIYYGPRLHLFNLNLQISM